MTPLRARARSALLPALATLAIIVGACGTAATSTAPTAAPTTAAPTAAPAAAPTAAPAAAPTAAPAAGGTLILGGAQGVPQLDPIILTFAYEEPLINLLWNGLTSLNQDGSIGPELAESWTHSDDLKTWTFKLRTDVKFLSGKQLTAKDVAATMTRVLDPKTPTQMRTQVSAVTKVTAQDDYTVVFQLSSADAVLDVAVSDIAIMDNDALATVNTSPNGSGPFKLAAFVPDQTVKLVRNEAYWGPRPSLDGINFVRLADPVAAVTALRSGEIHVMPDLPPGDANQLKDNPDVGVLVPDNPIQTPFYELDNTTPPFNDVRARQAMAHSVNRDAMLEAAYFGIGYAAPANLPLSIKSSGYNGDLAPYDFNLAKAKELFAAAGVTKLTYWSVAGAFPPFRTTGEILQADLASIGITMDIQENEVSTWAEKFYPPGKSYPGLVIPNYLSFTQADPLFILNFWLTKGCECNWSNAEYDKLYQQALAEPDLSARIAIYKQMQKIFYDDVPSVQLAQSTSPAGLSKKVSGVWMQPGGRLRLEGGSIAP